MSSTTGNNSNTFSVQRRRVLQGVGAGVAAIATPVIAMPSIAAESKAVTGSARISGTVVSKLDSSVKTLILENQSPQAVEIRRFTNGGLLFDGEVVDCNLACTEGSVSLAAGEKKVIQFEMHQPVDNAFLNENPVNVQSSVSRLHEGTRVIPISGTVHQGVVSL